MKGIRLYLLVLLGIAAVAATADWLRALLAPESPLWMATVVFFILVKATGDLIRATASPRERATAFFTDFLADLAYFVALGLVAALAIELIGGLVGARANPALVAVLAYLGIMILGGDRR